MLKIKEAIIVEGKYDKQRLKEFIDAPIITTSGFRVFKDKEKQALIRKLSQERGLLILTDSDGAGLVIRNFLKGIVPADKIKNCYIPQIEGKEKRKSEPSKEGYLGVEGMTPEILKDARVHSGVDVGEGSTSASFDKITKTDMMEMGLSGADNSAALRKQLMQELGIPTYLSANALLEILNSLYSKKEVLDKLKSL